MITRNYFKVVRVFPDPSDYFYIKNEDYDTATLYFENYQKRTDIDFKIDNGSWTNLKNYISDHQVIYIQPNSKLYLRGTAGYWKDNNNDGIYFYKNAEFPMSIGGDLRTLLNYTDVDSVTTIPTHCFNAMFYQKQLTSIENLTLGSSVTTIGISGVQEMFYGNPIQKGLDLSGVTTVGDFGLSSMYQGCTSLNEAYAPNVSTWNTDKTTFWLDGVASTGVLYKPANLTIPTGVVGGVPDGWTTQTYPNA